MLGSVSSKFVWGTLYLKNLVEMLCFFALHLFLEIGVAIFFMGRMFFPERSSQASSFESIRRRRMSRSGTTADGASSKEWKGDG